MACQRYWSFGAVELFRLRQTGALGYLRLGAESMAMFSLLVNDDALADRWFRLTGEHGKKFFSETQPEVKEVLKKFDLDKTYDMASSSAQHVRMAGLVRSMVGSGGRLSLPDQEFNPDDSFSYHLGVAHFHRIQSRILGALGTVIPDAQTEEWTKQEKAFRENAASLWKLLGTRYAKEIQEQAVETSA